MMTTETPTGSPPSALRGSRPAVPDPAAGSLVRALTATAAAGLAAAVLGLLVDGGSAALGVLVGLGAALLVFALGSFTVNVVAGVLPAAALMVALLTYALQLLLLLVVLSALEGSGALGQTLDRTWLGGALIGATVVWVVAQVVLHLRRRSLAYDLLEPAPTEPQDGDAR